MLIRRNAVLASMLVVLIALTQLAEAQVQVLTFTRPKEDRQLGFTPNGQVAKVNVKEGDQVKAGDELILLRSDDIQAAREVNRLNAESDLEVQAAQAESDLAKVELERTEDLFNRRAASEQELRRAKVQSTIASLRVMLAQKNLDIAKKELDRADVVLSYYTLKAPIDGIVARVIVSEGETVEQLKPVLRLVSIDPMEVHAPVPTRHTQKLKVGDPAWVIHQLPDLSEPMEGKITLVDPVADSGSDTRRVVIELPNPKRIPPGMQVSVQFEKPEAMVTAEKAGN